jgi:ABC-2 type transport system ATP-binding protein
VKVEVQHLTKVFPSRRRGPTTAVDDASFTIDDGQIVGILGANGAGKTTTIKCMCGLVRPTSGDVAIGGTQVAFHPRAAAKRVAAVLEGNRNLYWRLTARENVDLFAGLQGIPRHTGKALRDDLLERFGLSDKATTPARMMSRGMQQKLSLACALARRTPVLLLDEPTLGLDVEISQELRTYVRELARDAHTILLSSHDMKVVQDVCDRVVVLVDGRVVADDTVPNLLRLFSAQAYTFVVQSRLDGAQLEALRSRFPLLKLNENDGRTTISVEFADDRGIFDLVRALDVNGTVVESVDREEPDLEQVFLHLIKDARS